MRSARFGILCCYLVGTLVSLLSPFLTVAGNYYGPAEEALTHLPGMTLTHPLTRKRSRWIRSPSSAFMFSLRGVCDFDRNGYLDHYERRCLRRFSSLAFGR